MKLTARQRKALAAIQESGQDVVIEDDWNIYLSETRTCPFGFRNVSGDIEVIRAKMTKLDWTDVGVYKNEREKNEKRCVAKALQEIEAGAYYSAAALLRSADAETFTDVDKVEVYRWTK